MISMAIALAKQGKPHLIEVQGRQYEGLTVWFNSLVNSAGGQILSGPTTSAINGTSAQAAAVMHRLASSPAADPGLSNAQEDQARLGFETGNAAFEVNYPFVWPSAQDLAPKIAKVMGYAPWPSMIAGKPARVTIGGINLAVSSHSKHPADAFSAIQCLANAKHQQVDAIKGGLPPTLGALYDVPALAKAYPFHALIKAQLQNFGIRPKTPAYSDVSLAIQKAISPPASINPLTVESTLKSQIKSALSSGALL
jgi:multiple sugar transport system substrate-binding protein